MDSPITSKSLDIFGNLRAADHIIDDLVISLYFFTGLRFQPTTAIELHEIIIPQHAVLVLTVDDLGIEKGRFVINHSVVVKSLAFFAAEGEEHSCVEIDYLVGLIVGGVEESVAWYFCDVE